MRQVDDIAVRVIKTQVRVVWKIREHKGTVEIVHVDLDGHDNAQNIRIGSFAVTSGVVHQHDTLANIKLDFTGLRTREDTVYINSHNKTLSQLQRLGDLKKPEPGGFVMLKL